MKKITHTLVVMIIALVFLPLQAQIYTFTNAGASGSYGPTQGQVDAAYVATTLDGQVAINTQGIQEWTVPVTGPYSIEAVGAQGGAYSGFPGGLGASIKGEFILTAGDVINIAVGQLGSGTGSMAAGGGGGSFIYNQSSMNALLVAGGGGGTTFTGVGAINGLANNMGDVAGVFGPTNSAGGGGSLSFNGTSGQGFGGTGFLNGATGGCGWYYGSCNENRGGFGGGAGGSWEAGQDGGGGGGGYTGGDGGNGDADSGGSGGGSYNVGTNQTNTAGANTGNGQIVITLLAAPPVITCPGDITVSNDTGICGAVVNYTVTATDPEDGTLTPIQTAGLPSGSEFPVGVTTNTFEVTDSDANTVTCSFDVTVNDMEDPVITCPGNITQNNDLGICGAVVTYNISATDNCSGGSTTEFIQNGGFETGDFSGWSVVDTGSGSYYINDGTFSPSSGAGSLAPISGSFDVITDQGGPGLHLLSQPFIVPSDVQNAIVSWNDRIRNNAGVFSDPNQEFRVDLVDASMSVIQEVFSTNPGDPTTQIGPNFRQFDLTALLQTLSGQQVSLRFSEQDDLGNFNLTLDDISFVIENINITQTAGLPSGSTFPAGTTTNTFEVTDASGNIASCSFDVIVNDNEAPVFTDIYGDGTLANPFTSMLPEIVGSVPTGTYYFNFNGSTFQGALDNDTDGGGWLMILNYVHQAGDNSNLQVRNTDLPLLGASILGTSEAASPSWGHFGNVLAADIDFEEVRFFAQTSRDPNNIIDFTTDYSAVLEYVKTGNGSFSGINNPSNYTLGASHNASIPQNAPDFFTNEGDFALTNFPFWRNGQAHWGIRGLGNRWEVDDYTINSYSTIHRVWVKGDFSPSPSIESTSITVQLDGSGNVTISAADFGLTPTDNCGVVTQALSMTAFDCSNIGSNTIQLTATDAAGNETIIDVIVNVEDDEAPVINCVADTNRDTDAGVCQYTVVGTELDATFTDNCTSGSITNDLNNTATIAGEILPKGDTTVIWTVDDGNGQTATCTTVITVEDNEVPTIACPANTSANTDAGNCFATVSFTTPIAFDNCGVDTIVQTMGDPSGSQFPVGVNTIEFTATDVNGNSNTCSFTITVIDNEAPVAVCQNITIQLDANGNASIIAADVDGGSTDQCGVASVTIDNDTFDCSNVGDNNVILTVTDVNGNASTCTAIVTVEDVTAPVVSCQSITVELDPVTGTVTIAGTDIDNGSFDACGIASYNLDIDTFDCSNIGDNTVVLTVTDVNGNSETCTATVTVEDNTSPVLVCQDFTIEIGADGTATLDPNDVIASNEDACGILTIAVDITQFSCADIGTPITVQVFSQDNNGNLATCTATVTAVDLLAPVVSCPADQTVDPGQGNLFYILPDYFATGQATAVDNCTDPVTILTQSPAAGTALADGTFTITLSATDEYGNTGTCEFELTVESVLGTGNNSQNLESIAIYPNPAKGNVTIGNPQNLELETANIYDLTGRLVQSFSLKGMATAKTLNVDNLAAATYVVIIKGKEGQITKRLLKE
ncbi:HYR domain-containing protein [Aequorivita sublithincola DSM 14238]|uniref:HYR domain-containing protein n=1 Tax=Aequorivita sublithincola (strain DSM 14238 / LMG 21431 / ACAM 643 / 9-3) TaxID=746697 RepID=I3YTD9_AEQSU|nr:HYR domain-containing protein [Aequorivita sublithincola]AFL80257.1 HYR domain-containing protein [Aequorivita sublithincola DSM 14238]